MTNVNKSDKIFPGGDAMNKIDTINDLTFLEWSKTRESSGTAGSYLKSYSYSHGKKVYYKLSFFDDENGCFGYESFNEIISMNILKELGYNSLEYSLIKAKIKIKGEDYITYLTSSVDFKKPGESKITFENFYSFNKNDNESAIDFAIRMGFEKEIYQMIIIDYLICNRDRHGANIEVLYNKNTKKVRLAPLFDHGLSLLSPKYKESDIKEFDIKKDVKVNSFIGKSNLLANLDLVPLRYFPNNKIDFNKVFDCFGKNNDLYLKKAKEMLEWRWKKLENIRDKRKE